MRTHVLGVPIDTFTLAEATDLVISWMGQKEKMIFTPNPEMIVRAGKDKEFMEVLCKADLIVPDGIGVVLASKKIKERVAGFDLVVSVLKNTPKPINVYIFGAAKGVAKKAKTNIEKNYPNVKVVGTHSGFFTDDIIVIEEIQNLKPDLLLVGLGFPKQEKWIFANRDKLPVSIGVGGTIDVLAGVVKRAPDIFIKLGLEWFYRLLADPKRIFRMINLPLFVIKVLLSKGGGRN